MIEKMNPEINMQKFLYEMVVGGGTDNQRGVEKNTWKTSCQRQIPSSRGEVNFEKEKK